ncbi:CBS domain-containing protein [Cytobacillus eiseniae]|uniref:CBS domain-containing protein n=1 Tax=Cytobacillus eiseniae TaxID=762947 RepID=A0ABS4RBG8_9BACI|nr:CBS domain-containing protein [Cytobacillus eiseniae]MBP2240249.1 CBS domain-containing protein [Cytobacillus eiseniae]
MLVSDIMTTNFHCCRANDNLHHVLPLFTHTHSNILPVVNESNQLIGIITKNKIFRILATKPSFDMTIDHFYNPNFIFIRPTETIESTRDLLLKHEIGHAPVVDEGMKPIGVLSTQQVLSSYNIVLSQTKEWEQKLHSVIEFAYDAIILVNKNAAITMVNKGFTDLFDINGQEILNKSASKLFPELEIENVLNNGISIQNMH